MTRDMRRTDQFPAYAHRCAGANDDVVTLRFRGGAAISGLTVDCALCLVTAVYTKPMMPPREPEQGGRTHF